MSEAMINIPAYFDDDGELMVMTRVGYRKKSALPNVSIELPSVSVGSIGIGMDAVQQWGRMVDAGLNYQPIAPLQTPAGAMPNSSVLVGNSPKIGDYLRRIGFMLGSANTTNGAVYLEDGLAGDVLVGATSSPALGAPTAAPPLKTAANFTATQNKFAGYILFLEMIPTVGGISAGVKIKFMRRILSHPAYAVAGVDFVPTLTHPVPQGATITGWGIRPLDSAWQIRGHDNGPNSWDFGCQSKKEGGFRLSVDSDIWATVGGQLT